MLSVKKTYTICLQSEVDIRQVDWEHMYFPKLWQDVKLMFFKTLRRWDKYNLKQATSQMINFVAEFFVYLWKQQKYASVATILYLQYMCRRFFNKWKTKDIECPLFKVKTCFLKAGRFVIHLKGQFQNKGRCYLF